MNDVDICAVCKKEILPEEWFVEEETDGPLFKTIRHVECKAAP